MEIGLLEDYAVRVILYLGEREGEIISRSELSKATDVPLSVLAMICNKLEVAGLIYIARGRFGGYRLKKSPEEITLLDVIEAIKGKIYLNRCVDSSGFCARAPFCPVHEVWLEINQKFKELLKNYTFKMLLERGNKKRAKLQRTATK